MKQLYFLDEEERQRILNIHESATKRHYLGEQVTNQTNLPTITDNDKTYDYQKNGETYFFKVKPNATDKRAQKYKDGNWHQGIGNATASIKALFDKKPNGTQPLVKKNVKPVTQTDPSNAAVETAKVTQTTPTTTTPVTTTTSSPATVVPVTTTSTSSTPAPSGTNVGSGVISVNANDIVAIPETESSTPKTV